MKRKTHEEYVEELANKNPNVQVIEKYINSNTKILHKCLKHNIYWYTTPTRALKGVGCEECHKERIHESSTRTHEEYTEQLKRVNPNIIPLEKFKTINDPILHYCKVHDVTWNVIPDNVLRGHGCKECGNDKIGIKNSIPFEEYEKELHLLFPNIECVGNYINYTTDVFHRCNICGYEWSTKPFYIIKGVGCKKCNGNLHRATQEYIDDLQQINPQIELVGEYVNMSTPALHRCKIHNHSWNVTPQSLFQGTGCPICGREKNTLARTKTMEDFESELKLINPEVTCIGEYRTSLTKTKFLCLKCNNTWDTTPSSVLQGHGCPICNISLGENEIRDWLIIHEIEFIPQKRFDGCKDKRTLPFDFYIPSKNTVIEFDGEQHSRPIDWFGGKEKFDYLVKHDQIKTQYCADNNIDLLRISYKDNIQEKLNSFFI